jgi:hypothetical protein
MSPVAFTIGDPLPPGAINARRIELSFPLVIDGNVIFPSSEEQWRELTSIFPTTQSAWIGSPYLVIQVQELPLPPWPLSIGRIPLHLSTEDDANGPIDKGDQGRSRTAALPQYNLRNDPVPILPIFTDIVDYFKSKHVVVHEIFHFHGFFRLTVADDTNLDTLPWRISNQAAFYKFRSQEQDPDASALRVQQPSGVLRDNTNYLANHIGLLRPGVMVSTSLSDGSWTSTTLGILVVDRSGTPFITVADHVFNDDGEVWHPDPSGTLIGKIMHRFPDSDIALVQLEKNIKFDNKTFGNVDNPEGTVPSRIATTSLFFDNIDMNNPFSGYCVGQILAPGVRVEGSGLMIQHYWVIMDASSDQGPIDGSCGSAILNDDGEVVGFFRFKKQGSRDCYAVSSEMLIKAGYQIPMPQVQTDTK